MAGPFIDSFMEPPVDGSFLSDHLIVVFDLETTGRPLRRNATAYDYHVWPFIVSCSWGIFDIRGHMIARRHMIRRPDGFVIPEDAARIHGITTSMALRDGIPLGQVADAFLADLFQQNQVLLVAHNGDEFDRPTMAAELIRLGRDPSRFLRLAHIDTMKASINFCRIPWAGRRRPKGVESPFKFPTLEELHERLFAEKFLEAHTPKDVEACAKCFFELLNRKLIRLPSSWYPEAVVRPKPVKSTEVPSPCEIQKEPAPHPRPQIPIQRNAPLVKVEKPAPDDDWPEFRAALLVGCVVGFVGLVMGGPAVGFVALSAGFIATRLIQLIT
jgi:DNA polymerase III subunit epsilon